MASYNDPKVTNAILKDVPAIRELIRALAAMNPAGGGHTDIPAGAIQLVSDNDTMQFKRFSSNSWNRITERFGIDVEKVGGYKPSTTAAKGTLPVYNSQSKLPGSITGNAETASKLETARTIDLAGYISGTAVKFDGSKDISLEVTRIDVNNENDDVLNGKVSIKHGGTGRDDGAAADVVLPNGGKASQYGQIGNAITLAGKNINTITVDGNYVDGGNSKTVEMGYPVDTNSTTVLNVYSVGSIIHQFLSFNSDQYWHRYSANKGASWNGWVCVCSASDMSQRAIYVSKSGSDTNTGLSKEYPVLTIKRAMQIAGGLVSKLPNPIIKLCIGEGDWGSVTFCSLPFVLNIFPFDGANATEYSSSLPKFSTIFSNGGAVSLFGVVCEFLDCSSNGFVLVSGYYNRVATMRSRHGGIIEIDGGSNSSYPLEIISRANHDYVYQTYNAGCIVHLGARKVNIIENLNLSQQFLACNTCSTIIMSGAQISKNSGVTVTGRKYNIQKGSIVTGITVDALPGTIDGNIDKGAILDGIPYGTGASDEALMGDHEWRPVLLQSGGTMSGTILSGSTTLIASTNWLGVSIADTSRSTAYTKMLAEARDENGKRFFGVEVAAREDGARRLQFVGRNRDDTGWIIPFSVTENKDGSYYASCGTPPDSSNGAEIITASWYNKKIADYMPKAGGTFTGEVRGYTGLSNNSSNLLATTAWVRMATGDTSLTSADSKKWNGAGKTISTAMPSGGNDGDIWFRY